MFLGMPVEAIVLQRISYADHATLGVLKIGVIPAMLTLEDPWKANQKDISCISTGTYTAQRVYSTRFKMETFRLLNVPGGRSGIEFHPGNTELDTEGCILTGLEFGFLKGLPAVLESGTAFKKFMSILDDRDQFQLFVLYG